MNVKPIVVSGIVGGMVLTGFDGFGQFVAQIVAPYNIFDIGGMRPPDEPLLCLFFFYPCVLAFAVAILGFSSLGMIYSKIWKKCG